MGVVELSQLSGELSWHMNWPPTVIWVRNINSTLRFYGSIGAFSCATTLRIDSASLERKFQLNGNA